MEKKPQKKPKKYFCKKCDFGSNDKKDYSRHLTTRKHEKKCMDNIRITKKTVENVFECELCNKQYKYRSGLSKHNKCAHPDLDIGTENEKNPVNTVDKNSNIDELREMMINMVKVQKKTVDSFNNLKNMIPKLGNTTYNSKTSINVYLNHYCKDAINIQDFLDNLKISLDDLKYTKDHGYAKGISNIFVNQLKNIKPSERPIHCSDKKRLHFYVKDNDSWDKDDKHTKIDSALQDITIKQIKQLKEWEKAHPNYLQDETLLQEWHDMVHSVMGGDGGDDREKKKNIIKKDLGITLEMKDDMLENLKQ